MLAIADPSWESFLIAKMLRDVASKLGKSFLLVLNKVTDRVLPYMRRAAERLGLEVTGVVRFDEELARSSLEENEIKFSTALNDISTVVDRLLSVR